MAYQYLGFANLKLHDVDSAIDNYAKAVDIDNDDWMAHKGLGVAYMLKSINSKDQLLRNMGIEEWNMSLDIKPNQPKLKRLLKKYSNQ